MHLFPQLGRALYIYIYIYKSFYSGASEIRKALFYAWIPGRAGITLITGITLIRITLMEGITILILTVLFSVVRNVEPSFPHYEL